MSQRSRAALDSDELRQLHSGEYVQKYEHKPVSRLERLVPLMRLTGGEVVADLACGNAMLLQLIAGRVQHYYGVDFSPEFIDAAKRRAAEQGIHNATFVLGDIVDFCAEHPAAFDVATAFDFSEHIYDDDFRRIFSAIQGSLKPAGRLLLHTPNLGFFLERLKAAGVVRQFPEHIAVRDEAGLVALLRECGFGSIKRRRLAHYNVLKVLHPLRGLPVFGSLFVARLFLEARPVGRE